MLELRYEQLITQTEKTLREVLAFLAEPWHDAVLNYHENAQARDGEPKESGASDTRKPVYRTLTGRWQREMSKPDRIAFHREAGNLLKQLGYARDSWLPRLAEATLSLDTLQVL